MKKVLMFAAAAAMFAACSNSDDALTANASQQALEPNAVGFDAYLLRNVTRAGDPGTITTASLQAAASGFGVFGYYTDNNDYEPLSLPNFMYNQQVTYDSGDGYWKYEPVKYWPNEYGSNAVSDDDDKVSFFAYAPWVNVTPSTGKVAAGEDKYGIVGMSRNSASGDPIIKYIASFDTDKSVDLLWGTIPASTTWNLINGGSTDYTTSAGLPWLNVQRPKEAATQTAAAQRVKFQFEHALAQLDVKIDADVDGTDETNPVDSKTRIWVRSITFNGFSMKGALNLNNIAAKKANWLDFGGVADLVNGEAVTVFDGLKDGKEGTAGNVASNEKTLGLNPQIIQSSDDIDFSGAAPAWKAANTGVTNTPVSLFRKYDGSAYTAADVPVMVIPNGDEFTVEIVYDVETLDPNLANYVSDNKTKGSSIENRISKTVTFGSATTLENGKKYTLKLHLGMNSVKLDAAVSDWDNSSAAQEVKLPSNN